MERLLTATDDLDSIFDNLVDLGLEGAVLAAEMEETKLCLLSDTEARIRAAVIVSQSSES
jgi:hypothetical protein